FGRDGKQQAPMVVHGTDPVNMPIERMIRRAVTKIVKDRDGFIEAAGNYHFELPSQRHTERFLRISNVMVDAAEISFIALGILPFVHPEIEIAYVDTPALFSV